MPELSYDQLVSEFIAAKSEQDDQIWRQAAIACFLRGQMLVPAKSIAADVGYSSRYISQLIKTFEAFPDEDSRARDQSFSLHAVCATTDDPEAWLQRALEEGWSVRDIKEAIAGDKEEPDPVEKVWKPVEKVLADGGETADRLLVKMRQVILPVIPEAEIQEEQEAATI